MPQNCLLPYMLAIKSNMLVDQVIPLIIAQCWVPLMCIRIQYTAARLESSQLHVYEKFIGIMFQLNFWGLHILTQVHMTIDELEI